VNATVARLTARSLLGRRRALLLLALPVVLLLLCALARGLAGPDEERAAQVLGGFALATVVPLLALIAGTGSIGPEIDDGSIVYLLSKPLSRMTIVVTKVAVAAAVVLALGAVPTFLAGLVLTGTADRIALSFGVAAAASGVAYCALFVMLAVISRNAVVIGLVYVLLWESLIGQFVPGAQALSIQQWALAIAQRLLGDRAEPLGVSAAVDLVGIPLLLVVLVGCTWWAGRRLRSLRLVSES